jgi:polyisoprenoid-binding protein YceI
MKKFILSLFLIFAKVACAVAPGEYFFTCTGSISFVSNAPLEIIKASSNQLKGLIDETKKSFSFRVAYQTFEGFNSGLQQDHFNEKYMESEKYPEAIFNGTIANEIDFSKNGTYPVTAKGILSIHGVEKERTIKSTLIISSGQVHIESKFNVLLEDHNIKIPKIVMQKIATEIAVEVKADLKKKTLGS